MAISVILWPSQGVCSETPLLPTHLLFQLEQIRKNPTMQGQKFLTIVIITLKINHNRWHLHTYKVSSNHQHQGMNQVNEGCQNSIPTFTGFGWVGSGQVHCGKMLVIVILSMLELNKNLKRLQVKWISFIDSNYYLSPSSLTPPTFWHHAPCSSLEVSPEWWPHN